MRHLNLESLTEVNLDKELKDPNICRVGYELTGFFECEMDELQSYIHIFGKKETDYLKTLGVERREEILNRYFSYPFPAVILSQEADQDDEFLRIAKKYKKPVFKSPNRTTETLRDIKFYLQRALSEEVILEDYIFMEVYGVGVLITGYDEAKFGVTIELLERSHKMITDDNLIVKKQAIDELRGMNRTNKNIPDSHFFLLNKDNSKIDVTTHFGIKGTRTSKRIDIIVALEKWNEKKFYDRLGLDEIYETILGVNVPKVVLPVRKGRNLAVIIEAAAMNHRLKKMGVNSAEYFWNESKKIIMENRKRKEEFGLDNRKRLPAKEFIKNFSLEIIAGESYVDENTIFTTGIHRPSLALSGYFDMYDNEGYNGVQIFSEIEFKFLEKLPLEQRIENLERYLNYRFPILVVTKNVEIPNYFLELVIEKKIVLCRSGYEKATQAMAVHNNYLENYFTPEISMHGVFLELYGFGVLLVGKSGIGKSETALELIHRGHRLVADDLVKFIKTTNGDVVGKAAKLPYFMEVRGLGIIDIKALYGLGAVRISKNLDAIIELQELKSEEYLTSVNYQSSTVEILGKHFHKVELYISSGRNAAAMVEIAVMNLMAKRLGHDPERAYREGIERLTAEEIAILDL